MAEEIPGYDRWKLSDGLEGIKEKVVYECGFCERDILAGHEALHAAEDDLWFCDEQCYKLRLKEDPSHVIDVYVELLKKYNLLVEKVVEDDDDEQF